MMKRNQFVKILLGIMRMKMLKVWKLMPVDSVSFNVNGNYTGVEQWNMAHEYADVIVRDFLRYKDISFVTEGTHLHSTI